MIITFTDLDGSLLDSVTYSWAAARPALNFLEKHQLPWVMVSSKTRAEVERLRAEMGHSHPFVVENGGAAFIPQGYFGGPVENAVIRDGYHVLEWGKPYAELVAALEAAAASVRCPVAAFHAMPVKAVSEATGLPLAQAELARRREYDEAFSAPHKARIPYLLGAIDHSGLRWTHGGRFYHICGGNDKGLAVAALIKLFTRAHGPVTTIGLGDSVNDLPFLDVVDIPVLVRSNRAPSVRFRVLGSRYTRSVGPKGWNEAVLELLEGQLKAGDTKPA